MTLKEAISKAEKFRASEVGSGNDCGDFWVFGFVEDEGRKQLKTNHKKL